MLSSAFRTSSVSSRLGRRAASSIALKYSNALYSAALTKSPQVLTKVQTELNVISKSINDTPELSAFISNPTLSAKERSAGLAAVYAKAEGAGAKKEPVSDVTKNLFAVLSENGRLGEMQGVIEGFNALVTKYKGELEVVVTSATPIPKDAAAKLETILKQSQTAQQAKTLKVTNKVNPSVLGGIVVDFGDKSIDLSVSSRVNKLNNILQGMCLCTYQALINTDRSQSQYRPEICSAHFCRISPRRWTFPYGR
ncbi:OSCP, subunit 5 of the stator stalk of mitochondrial F1F0 ATP synthase [Melanogaster broomeanus]|nr:OSCP, subunit 5 of the stator stalk of mitochondrial F1F0 ATP synthase [Melanogaster broomeanus]